MRNLKHLGTKVVTASNETGNALYFSVDPDVGTVYITTSTTLLALDISSQEVIGSISLRCEETDGDSTPVGLQYLCDQQAVCVATRDGRICLWQLESTELECVGEVEQGLTSMSWSPDLELLVISTGNNTVILMTREFDPITETGMFPEHSGEESPVSVGWGKKETQFHGSLGKAAAKIEEVKMSPTDASDSGVPVISWRGDGQFLAISAVSPVTGARSVTTWSRELMFQSQSEPVNGLQETICWKPSGALIAAVQSNKSTSKQEVVFFEKNGLRHGEFTIPSLPGKDLRVRKLMWNQDSSVLGILLEDDSQEKVPASIVQLWTVNNYHWYLKQSLQFEDGVGTADWDVEHVYRMHVITRSGTYLCYSWHWTTDHSAGTISDDLASVAVIDGVKILVTPMRKMVVPPPMAAFTLALPSPVNIVTFDPTLGSNAMAALMTDRQVAIFRYQGDGTTGTGKLDAAGGDGFVSQCDLPSLSGVYKITDLKMPGYPLYINYFVWMSATKFGFCTVNDTGSASTFHIAEVKDQEKTISVRNSILLEDFVHAIALHESSKYLVIQLCSGELMKLVTEIETLEPWETNSGSGVRFPYPCTTMAVTSIDGQDVVLGLTDRFRFYVNEHEIASNCTSFGIHNDFLLLTTLSHTIRCISRSTRLSDLLKLSDSKAHPFDESIRRVERGSRIVTVVADDTKLVLQMPRGNLETIHPRALVLSCLQKLLDSDQIRQAFIMMRKHRINMNLLFDHNPAKFLANIHLVVSQIHSVNHFNLFLTDLREEDVTKTMYTASYQYGVNKTTANKVLLGSKIDCICDALLEAFNSLGKNKYLLSILTAHVKKTEPELEKALLLIWSLQSKDTAGDAVSAEEALKYLLFLVDVNTLYTAALGTYNFDLVMMVAEKSQKDPKEYIPFLNQLRRLEEKYRCYTIDKHLKKYSKALEHIAQCGNAHFDECVTFVSEQKLHAKALRLYTPGSSQHKQLSTLYGHYLESKNRYDEAGIMFSKAEEWELALESFIKAHDWQQAFCMTARLEYSSNKVAEIATTLASDLKNLGRYAEAAVVYEEYAGHPEEAVSAFVEGSLWQDAIRLVHKHKRLDMMNTLIKDAVHQNYEHRCEMLNSQKDLFERYKNRLAVVRAEKEKAKADMMEGISDYNAADADLFSDTTSMTGTSVVSASSANSSRSTVFTKTGSARTRRKAENKRWSLKEGSANEEFALVEALAAIIKNVDSMREETSRLMKILILFNYDDEATSLQKSYSAFLALIQDSISEIWQESTAGQNVNNLGPTSTANSIALAMQRGEKPQDSGTEKLAPVLLVPPTLSKDTRWKLHIATDQERGQT